MITVSISINGSAIFTRSARNTGKVIGGQTLYDVDDGNALRHKREDGAVKLAIQMLKLVKEPREDKS